MFLTALVWCTFVLAVIPALLFVWNLFLYQRPRSLNGELLSVSILIPARNEERTIRASALAALESRGVDLEVFVLDDDSHDLTAQIATDLAKTDSRLKLISAPPLPPGWCGKQFACSVLAAAATKRYLCFIDADVRLAANGVSQMVGVLRTRNAALVSGFPRQITESPAEQLLLPLMHFLLLGYLPLAGMRKNLSPAFGAGCGQIFIADASAYRKAGGHASIRNSRHDGITLPKAFRRAGFMTDLCDATAVAQCRMYSNTGEVFHGLLKNATEGIAAPGRILPFSVMLFIGQVLPLVIFFWALHSGSRILPILGFISVLASYAPRLIAACRFQQPLLGALLHPFGILVLLVIQWYSFVRALMRVPATWKGRKYSTDVGA